MYYTLALIEYLKNVFAFVGKHQHKGINVTQVNNKDVGGSVTYMLLHYH